MNQIISDSRNLEALFDQKDISLARSAAEEKFKDLSSDHVKMLKRKLKTDLFFLATALGYDLLSPRLHGHLANWITKNRGWRHKLVLLPRNHYKSTVDTIVDSIQMALPVGDSGVQAYPYSLGPNVKILLAHEVRDKAADFLFEIAQAFTRSDVLLAFFPECIPSRQIQRINRYELELPRTAFHRESTFETIGSGSASQGGHYHWLKLDDLFGEEARDSETTRAKILRWFGNINSLLTRPKLDGWTLTGTRWSFNDIYSYAINRYGIDIENSVLNCIPDKEIERHGGGLLRIYARGIVEKNLPIFPEEVTLEHISILRKEKLDFAAQQANNPLEGGLMEFIWPLKFYNTDARGNIVIFSGESSTKIDRGSLDIIVLCDPSMGENEHADETGIVITGVDDKSNIFILETIKKRLIPPVFVDEAFRLQFKYQPRLIAIEEVNFSAIYKYWIEERAGKIDTYLPIRAYKPGSQKSKDGRIRGLSHLFSAGQIYCHEMMHDFQDEYEQFPLGKSKHLLDALAQGPNFWHKGASAKVIQDYSKIEEELFARRSKLTGY